MIIRFANIGALGVVKDLPPSELPPEAWSDGSNVRFEGRNAEKIGGNETIYNVTVGSSTVTQALAISPWFAMPVETPDDVIWLYAGKNHIYAANWISNHNKLTRATSATSSSSHTYSDSSSEYSATADIGWNGCVLSGLPIMNNSIDAPQVWVSATIGNTVFVDLQWDASAGTSWADASVTCKVIRSYREYCVALYTTESSVEYPRRVRWSHPSVPGAAPETWDETRRDKDAGYWDLEGTTDPIIDGLALRDTFVIYKRHSAYVMQWTGGILVMAFRKLFDTFGIFAEGCVVEYAGAHIVMTDNDVLMHDGNTSQSIIQDYWKNYLFSNINKTFYKNTFMVRDIEAEEVWICFPSTAATEPYWCDKALCWNARQRSWYLRDLPKLAKAVHGPITYGADIPALYRWNTIAGDWSAHASTTWKISSPNVRAIRGVIGVYPEDLSASGSATVTTSASSEAKLVRMNSGYQFNGTSYTSELIRESIPLIGQDRVGNIRIDIEDYKQVQRVWPHIIAADGVVVQVAIGTQKHPGDTVTWGAFKSFTVGTDEFLNFRDMGRIISIRFKHTDNSAFKMTGYDIEFIRIGRF